MNKETAMVIYFWVAVVLGVVGFYIGFVLHNVGGALFLFAAAGFAEASVYLQKD